jgi:hypothetical protein
MTENFYNLDVATSRKSYLTHLKNGDYTSSEKQKFMRTAMAYGDAGAVDTLLKHGVKPTFLKFAIVYPHMTDKAQKERRKVAAVLTKHGIKVPKASKSALKRSLSSKKRSGKKRSSKKRSAKKAKRSGKKRSSKKRSAKRRSSKKRSGKKRSAKKRSGKKRSMKKEW